MAGRCPHGGFRFGVILASGLTAGLLIWRFVKGTPPQIRQANK